MHRSHGPFIVGSILGLLVAMHLSPVSVRGPSSEPAPIGAMPTPEAGIVRIGVYDSRGVAIAWAQSEHNDTRGKKAAHQKAADEGDEARVAELERWGAMRQRKMHFQGFGSYPVDAYIAEIRDRLPALLERRGLDAIVWKHHAHRERVEIVDVTVDLMVLLGMDPARAEETAREMSKHQPLDFETLFEMDPMD